MSVPNFSLLACLEVAEKFVVGGGVGHMATMSNLNPSYVEWSWVKLGLGFDKSKSEVVKFFTLFSKPSFIFDTFDFQSL